MRGRVKRRNASETKVHLRGPLQNRMARAWWLYWYQCSGPSFENLLSFMASKRELNL